MEEIWHALGYMQVAGGIFIAMIILERAYWIKLGRLSVYDVREALANISTGVLYKLIDGVVLAVFLTNFYDWFVERGLRYTFTNKWVGIFVLFVIADLLFYLIHCVMHKTRYAWCAHITHHSSSRFNLSTALRQNFLFDLSGAVIMWCLPLALIGFSSTSAVVVVEWILAYQFFVHTEMVDRLPAWYEFIFNTPSHHRVHHSQNPDELESNLGGVLIIWDRLFGTFRDERDVGKITYGIPHRMPQTLNPLRLNLSEWFAMWRDVWRFRDLRILWKHPDWLEETYRSRQSSRDFVLDPGE